MRSGYSKDQIVEFIKDSISVSEVLEKIGLSQKGGNYKTFHKFVKEYGIDTSHFLGQAIHKGKRFGPKRDIQDYLSNECSISSNNLKQRLINEKFFERMCYSCGRSQWEGKDIPLELDHINGIHSDNSLENLRLLCPNCHALTDTYRGRNKQLP
jgi:hypothetical protein